MTTFDYSADPERAATRSSDRSDPASERIHGDAGRSYGRALAALMIAIADITSEPTPTRPPIG